MEASSVKVWPALLGGIQVSDLQVSTTNEIVVAHDNTSDGGKEDGVGGEIGGEVVGSVEEVPWTHYETNHGTDVASTTNVKVTWKQSSHICSS